MPSWITHLATATNINKKIQTDTNSFLFGNLIPDAETHVISDLSVFVPYHTSHFTEFYQIGKQKEELASITKFLAKYQKKIENPLILGYFVHLISDYYWNYLVYSKFSLEGGKGINLKNGKIITTHDERLKAKHNDFDLFSQYLREKEEIICPKYDISLLENIKDMEDVPLNKEDIQKEIHYASKLVEIKKEKPKEYLLFSEEDIKKAYQDCLNYTMEQIEKIKK